MIRLSLLWLFIGAICVMTWRDRFLALCGLILMGVLSQHPDMPTNIMGIPGLNPWNICFGMILLSWFTQIQSAPPAPTWAKVLFGAYFLMLMAGGIVTILDINTIYERAPILQSTMSYGSEADAWKDLIFNSGKYIVAGALFFMGCNTRKRGWLAVGTICLLCVLFALLTYKTMKTQVLLGNYEDARRMTRKLIGLHANDLAGLLTCGMWTLVVVALVNKGRALWLLLVAGLVLPTIVGCHSRAAYVANVVIAFVLAAIRWRWMLFGFPVMAALAIVVFPQIASRMGMDLGASNSVFQQSVDWNAVTAGRTENLWSPVIPEIEKSIIYGHGRLAIVRTNATFEIARRERFVPTHPHNSYLEVLLDFGMLGLSVVLGLVFGLAWISARMFRSTLDDPLVQIAGGIGLVAAINVLVLGLASQFFYPKESLMWLFCSGALALRMWTIYQARLRAGIDVRQGAIVEHGGMPPYYGPQPGYTNG